MLVFSHKDIWLTGLPGEEYRNMEVHICHICPAVDSFDGYYAMNCKDSIFYDYVK